MAALRVRATNPHSDAGLGQQLRLAMTVYTLDPVNDERWGEFLERHPAASIFHTPEWLEALRRTYGYKPIALTTSPLGCSLTSGIACCGIASWLGSRLVSLPFSDHCAPLAEDSGALTSLLTLLREVVDREWKYVEIRPADSLLAECEAFEESESFFLHKLDLRSCREDIFRNLHKDCVQRKIQRATREGLTQETGRSERLLTQFYRLLLMTRRRHGVPPQPLAWFGNLIACLGDKVRIRIASKDGGPVAGILTLQYKQTLVYKYGCSDEKSSQFGGMQMLLWKAIEDAKTDQLTELDMGRSDCANSGLVTFKDRWGATRTRLTYLRYPRVRFHPIRNATQGNISKRIFACMPDGLLTATGRVLYKHLG